LFIVDAHQDLAYSALVHKRDLMLPLVELRRLEGPPVKDRGIATITFPELFNSDIGLVFATLFADSDGKLPSDPTKSSAPVAPLLMERKAMMQLDYYQRLADEHQAIRLVGSKTDLDEVIRSRPTSEPLLGLLPAMEGADPIQTADHLAMWYERGLRAIGLAWDDSRYSAGAWRNGGPLTASGRHLLRAMTDFNFILDLTHMAELATMQALDLYDGPIIASHSNARALVPGERQLGDRQITAIAERSGVIGIVLFNKFLKHDYDVSAGRGEITLDHVVAHIDHICQLTGSSENVGIGSDFDGGFGAENIPSEMDTIADLSLIAGALTNYGYNADDVAGIMGGNWLRFLGENLPA